MTKFLLTVVALCAGGVSMAQEVGRVLSSTPVVQQVGVPRQVCTTEQVEVQTPNSGAGAALGAIAGGALGNSSGGHGAGRAAATVIGAIGGAMVGNRIEGTPDIQTQNMQRCGTQTFFENRTIAYNVVYEYAGRQYSVQMPNDPGPTIALQVSPVGANAQAPAPVVVQQQAPVYVQPAQVVVTRQYYPYYYPTPLFAPLSLNFGFGYGGHGHGHWR
jgi:uncharacterized protein YcfJ